MCGLVVVISGKIYQQPLKALSALILMAVLALVVTLISSEGMDATSALRGTFYFARVIAFTYLGYAIAKLVKTDAPILVAFLAVGTFVAASYLVRYTSDPLIRLGSREDVRNNVGTGGLVLWLVPCMAVLLWRRMRSMLDRWLLTLCSAVSIAATIASTSRSAYLSIGVFVLVLLLPFTPRIWRNAPFLLVLALLAMLALFTPLVAWSLGTNVFFDLSGGPFNELMPPYAGGMGSINQQWRGYEAWAAFRHVFGEGGAAIAFGTGLASQVPLGIMQVLAGQPVQKIEIFHSGFSFAFVRAGVVGLALYLWFVARSLRSLTAGMQQDGTDLRVFRAGLAAFIVLALGTPTIAGVFNPDDTGQVGLLLFGMALARAYRPAAVPA